MCINDTWGTICDYHWTKREASVVCSQLGYSPYGMHYIENRIMHVCIYAEITFHCLFSGAMAITNLFVNYEWPVGLFELACIGNETNIWDCMYNITNERQLCDQDSDASVFCMREFNLLKIS